MKSANNSQFVLVIMNKLINLIILIVSRTESGDFRDKAGCDIVTSGYIENLRNAIVSIFCHIITYKKLDHSFINEILIFILQPGTLFLKWKLTPLLLKKY